MVIYLSTRMARLGLTAIAATISVTDLTHVRNDTPVTCGETPSATRRFSDQRQYTVSTGNTKFAGE